MMPISPDQRDLYPADWAEISRRIRTERARNACERCSVQNHALGGRMPNGAWLPADPIIGPDGITGWPRPGTTAWCRGHIKGSAADVSRVQLRIIRIVLTVAHLDQDPTHNDERNLMALCQRCHLAHDRPHNRRRAAETRRARKAASDLLVAVSTGGTQP